MVTLQRFVTLHTSSLNSAMPTPLTDRAQAIKAALMVACELLRLFRVDEKSSLYVGYYTVKYHRRIPYELISGAIQYIHPP